MGQALSKFAYSTEKATVNGRDGVQTKISKDDIKNAPDLLHIRNPKLAARFKESALVGNKSDIDSAKKSGAALGAVAGGAAGSHLGGGWKKRLAGGVVGAVAGALGGRKVTGNQSEKQAMHSHGIVGNGKILSTRVIKARQRTSNGMTGAAMGNAHTTGYNTNSSGKNIADKKFNNFKEKQRGLIGVDNQGAMLKKSAIVNRAGSRALRGVR